jgi:hypothetical protein
MKWLIRRVVKKGKGVLQYEEDIHFGDELSVGRGSDQAIFVSDVRVALDHAMVRALAGGKKYRIESLIAAGVRVNGHLEQGATVKTGATLELGNVRITLIEPPQGYEAAVEVAPIDKTEQAARLESERLPNTLLETGLSKRRPSWLLFAFFLTTCLLIPLAAHYIPAIGKPLRGTPLSTAVWESGELAAPHHYFGQDCTECHSEGFVSAKDAQCLNCHERTQAHADPHIYATVDLADADCAYCHRDHNGVDGLIISKQSLCSDCHVDITRRTNNVSKLAKVGDFGTDHPQFMVNLPAWTDTGEFKPRRVSMDSELVENSGLKFPHDKHLGAVDGLNSPRGKQVLDCDSCHKPEVGGARMAEIDFESHCQDCHRLTFDRLAGDRQVRHANVPEILAQLQDYYAKRALDGDYEEAAAPSVVRRRRIPGAANAAMSAEEKRVALDWARNKANLVTRTLFEGKACDVCHTVTSLPASDEGMLRYAVKPVRVAGAWYAKSEFTHDQHQNGVRLAGGDVLDCASCHAAASSNTSAHVLIPDIANCRSCHAGEGAKGLLASTCIDCHGFHQAPWPLKARTELRAKSTTAPKPASALGKGVSTKAAP